MYICKQKFQWDRMVKYWLQKQKTFHRARSFISLRNNSLGLEYCVLLLQRMPIYILFLIKRGFSFEQRQTFRPQVFTGTLEVSRHRAVAWSRRHSGRRSMASSNEILLPSQPGVRDLSLYSLLNVSYPKMILQNKTPPKNPKLHSNQITFSPENQFKKMAFRSIEE